MYEEISAAVLFLMRLVSRNGTLVVNQVEEFGSCLSSLLMTRYRNHWFPEKPSKGQGYRCIRMNEVDRRDPVLEAAAKECGFTYEELGLPVELTVWVDPKEVCCRFGEHKGSYCTVASFQVSDKENCEETNNYERVERNGICIKNQKQRIIENVTSNMVTSEPQFIKHLNQVSISGTSPSDYRYFLQQMQQMAYATNNSVKRHVLASRIHSAARYALPPSMPFTECGPNRFSVRDNDHYQWINKPLLKA